MFKMKVWGYGKKYEEKVVYGHTEAKQENRPLHRELIHWRRLLEIVSMDKREDSNPPKTQRPNRKTSNQN